MSELEADELIPRALEKGKERRLEHKQHEVKPRTHEFYTKYAELYIRPHIGGTKLAKLTTPDVR